MQRRLQVTADDTVLEITDNKPTKSRLSSKALLRQKAYLQQTIEHFQDALAVVDRGLAMIDEAKKHEATRQ